MRAQEFLIEFDPAPGYITPDAGNHEPLKDKQDILVLLGFKPTKKALDKIDAILDLDLDPIVNPDAANTTQAAAQPKATAATTPPAANLAPTTSTINPLAPIRAESIELDEANIVKSLMEKIQQLDPNNPKDAYKLSQIEAILEGDIIDPAISKIISKKFKSSADKIIADFRTAINESRNSIIDKIKFLTRCDKGLISLQDTFNSSTTGNIYSIVNDPVLDSIKNKLASIEYGTGASKLGKMEVLLILIGKGVSKQGSGDLTLDDGTEVEIKASSTAQAIDKKGNKKISTSGSVMYALAKETGSSEKPYGSNEEALKVWQMGFSKITGTPIDDIPRSLSDLSVKNKINPLIIRNRSRTLKVTDLLKKIFRIIFKKAPPGAFNQIDKYVSFENGINIAGLIKFSRKVEFDYYQKVVKHDAILFINTTSGNYYYITSGMELSKLISTSAKGSGFYTTGLMDLAGTYANGMSKIFVK